MGITSKGVHKNRTEAVFLFVQLGYFFSSTVHAQEIPISIEIPARVAMPSSMYQPNTPDRNITPYGTDTSSSGVFI